MKAFKLILGGLLLIFGLLYGGGLMLPGIDTLLDFGPDGTAIARFDIESTGDTSRVTWSLDTEFGDQVVGRYIGLIFDQLIGPDYEQGLKNLKQLVEGRGANEIS